MITGESMPVAKESGSKLIGGTLNGTGSLVMRAERIGADMMLTRIVHMVAEAQRSRAPIQRLADAVSAWFVPAVIAVAGVSFVAWMLFGPAAALSIRARQRGVGADHRLPLRAGTRHAHVDHGGHRARARRRACSSAMPRRWSAWRRWTPWWWTRRARSPKGNPASSPSCRPAASMRQRCCASRPRWRSAASIRWPPRSSRAARERELPLAAVEQFRSVTGKGVTGNGRGSSRRRGQRATAAGAAASTRALLEVEAESLRSEGGTAMFVAIEGRPAGVIAVADPIKATTAAALRAAAGRWHPDRDAHRRQSHHRHGRGPPTRHRRRGSRSDARAEARDRAAAAQPRAMSWPWPATASTMRPRWPKPVWASPWGPARMWPCRAPA